MPAAAMLSPVGRLTVSESGGRVERVRWENAPHGTPTPLLKEAVAQLHAYFAGHLTRFDLPLALPDDGLEGAVYRAMIGIPRGSTATYGDLAGLTGSSARAVGQMCGRNPLPILVPCHRVVGASASGHYSGGGGAATKHWLLAHEGATLI